jgi:hypothetical protein
MSGRRTILITAVVAASLLLALGVATVSAGSQRAVVINVTMTGDQEVWNTPACAPPTVCGDPDAVGTAHIVVSPASDRVCFRLTWSGIDGAVWGAHIHGPATTSQAVSIVVPFLMRAPGAADNLDGTDSIAGCVASPDWADEIAADPASFYVNVHSFPSYNPGAIRAQLGG